MPEWQQIPRLVSKTDSITSNNTYLNEFEIQLNKNYVLIRVTQNMTDV